MIQAGWKRDVCPQCHMPGRVGERVQATLRDTDPTATYYTYCSFIRTRDLRGPEIHADFCDNCGVLYAYECVDKWKEAI